MAGSMVATATSHEGVSRRGLVRGLAVVLCLSIGAIFAAPAAQAQVPELPAIPEPVTAALQQAQDAAIPVLIQVAVASQPVSNATGFALRPGCAGVGTAVLLAVLLGGSLPFSPGFVSTPVLIFCAGAFAPGPADPVFTQIDSAAGAQAQSLAEPVLDQAGNGARAGSSEPGRRVWGSGACGVDTEPGAAAVQPVQPHQDGLHRLS